MSKVKGNWEGSNAGGCFNHASWRLNQQYSLSIEEEASDVKIDLVQEGNVHIGFYILKDTKYELQPIYHDEDSKLVHKSGFKSKQVVTLEISSLKAGIYHIIPCTFEPKKEAKFTLRSTHGKLKKISSWASHHWTSKWTSDTAGGCKNHKTFKNNPQLLFEVTEPSRFTGVMQQKQHDEFNQMGFYLFKTDGSGPVTKISSKDIIATSMFEDDASISYEVEQELAPGNYSIFPCTFDPNHESAFSFYAFTTSPITLLSSEKKTSTAASSSTPQGETSTNQSTQATTSDQDNFKAKYLSELSAHQQSIAKISALQEELRVMKDNQYVLKTEIDKLNKAACGAPAAVSQAPIDPTAPRVATTQPQHGKQVTILGSWDSQSAGGCMNHSTWRNNPQLFVTVPTDGTKVNLQLTQDPDSQDKYSQIGFYVLSGSLSKGRRITWLDNGEEDIIMKPKFSSSRILKMELTLPSTRPQEPLVMIPCTFAAGEEHDWTLSMSANHDITVSPNPTSADWNVQRVDGEWNDENAGGCKNHVSFFNNPQFLLTIPDQGAPEANLRIVLIQKDHEEFDPISIYLIKSSHTSSQSKPSKIVKLEASELLEKPKFADPCEYSLRPSQPLIPGNYIIIPCTFNPKQLAHFELMVTSSKPVQLSELGSAASLSISGSWKGKTAGGCMNDIISFKHNIQYHLNLTEAQELVFKLNQTSTNISSGVKSHGCYIFKGNRRILRFHESNLAAKIGFVKSADLVFSQALDAGNYIVIPCTLNPNEEANYTLSITPKSQSPDFAEKNKFEPVATEHQEFEFEAEWNQNSAGGSLNHLTWITNPQFQFTTAQQCDVDVFLSVPSLNDEDKINKFSGLGIYVVPSHPDSSVRFEMQPSDIFKKVPFRKTNENRATMTLDAGSYNFVCCTLKSGFCAPFIFSLFTNNTISSSCTLIKDNVVSLLGEWTEKTAGGNTSNMEKWLLNPKFFISVVSEPVKISAVLLQRPELSYARGDPLEGSKWKAIGFAVTNGDLEGNPQTSEQEDLISAAPFEAERDVSTVFTLEPSVEPYVVTPSTFEAGLTGTFSVSFVFDPRHKNCLQFSSTPPKPSDAASLASKQSEILIQNLQRAINNTATSGDQLAKIIKKAKLSALDLQTSQLNAQIRKIKAVINAMKAAELTQKEEAEAVKTAMETSSLVPPPPPPTSVGTSNEEDAYDGASKGLKPAKDRAAPAKPYSSPQEEMLALIAQGRAQLKKAADRKLRDKPSEDSNSLFCAFSSSFDQLSQRRRSAMGEEEESNSKDDDWD